MNANHLPRRSRTCSLRAHFTVSKLAAILLVLAGCLASCWFELARTTAAESDLPNIVIILADDLGYGDVQAFNPDSKIPTPHLNRLASQGMMFTDAHSPSAVCTPTRYGLLTGRYCWRTRLKRGVLSGYSEPLIARDQMTIASMLKQHGYRTAAIGKWHLGMTMPRRNAPNKSTGGRRMASTVDFQGSIKDGPTTRGFDYYFGVSASLDMPPYVFIENDHFANQPDSVYPGSPFPKFIRKGPHAADFRFDHVLERLAERASGFIKDHADAKQPFFLYLPLTGPHKPIVPHPDFVGRTDLGPYGDFVVNVDSTVGRVLKTIHDCGIDDQTLVVFTSDNGSYMFRTDDSTAVDHVTDPSRQLYRSDHHRANGPLRGTKADIWEGGHRVPFIARWPGKIKARSKSGVTICHTDLLATMADVVGATIPQHQAEDSYSALPILLGKEHTSRRPPVIHHSVAGMFAIRSQDWKLVAGNGSGGRQTPKGKPFARPYQLFNLKTDLAEHTNVAEQHPEIVEQLTRELDRIRGEDSDLD